MKKFCLLLTLGAIVSLSAVAQNATSLKPFKVDVSVGYAIPGGSGAKGGVLFAIEPKYAVMSQLALGLRMEAAVVARGFANVESEAAEVELDVKASSSYLLTGDYYFTGNYSFRPFGGIGAGIYSIAAAQVATDGNGNATTIGSAGNKFGGLVRAGFEAGHFRLGLEYNLVPKTKIDAGSGQTIESKNGYIGMKLGVCIGGGRRK
jgi:hypothetical protein